MEEKQQQQQQQQQIYDVQQEVVQEVAPEPVQISQPVKQSTLQVEQYDQRQESYGLSPQQPQPYNLGQQVNVAEKVVVSQQQPLQPQQEDYVEPVQIPEQPQDEPALQQTFQVENKVQQPGYERETYQETKPSDIQQQIQQFAQKQTNEKLGGGVVSEFPSANRQKGIGRPVRPRRPTVVQEPTNSFFLQGFPEVAAPEGGDVPLDEQAAIREAIFELKKERRSG